VARVDAAGIKRNGALELRLDASREEREFDLARAIGNTAKGVSEPEVME